MESCDFVNEEFPAEIQKLAKTQLPFDLAKTSNFLYTVLANVIFFYFVNFIAFAFFPRS
jgi:hypothetical protein